MRPARCLRDPGHVQALRTRSKSPLSIALIGPTEAMQLMVEGDKFEMYIPSDLAYGESGSPPKIPGASVPSYLTQCVFKVVLYKSTPLQIRQRILHYYWYRA